MNIKSFFIILTLLSYSFFSQSQKIHIKKINFHLINKFIANEINKFIDLEESKDSLFKSNFGFVVVKNIENLSHPPFIPSQGNRQPILTFTLILGSYYLTPNTKYTSHYCENCYPTFYTKYNKRIILIYDEKYTRIIDNKYSIKSQKKLEKELIPHFKHTLDENFNFWDPFNKKHYKLSSLERKKKKKKDLYKEASYMYNELRKVTLFNDGTVKYE